MSTYLATNTFVFASKAPEAITTFGNLTQPFDMSIWLCTFLAVAVIASCIAVAHKLYSNINRKLVKAESQPTNFFLFTFCKITEPEPLPWFFKGLFGGPTLVFLWSLLAWLLIMFYQSNLRAHMIASEYEKPMDTLQDVLDRSTRVWIANVMTHLR